MRKYAIAAGVLTLSVIGVTSHAFFDEVVALREELKIWETTHAADFNDVIAQLEDITGPVFNDVTEADWFSPFVAALAEWEIVSGYRDDTGRLTGEFSPSRPVTIAEILKMAMKAAKVDTAECTGAPQYNAVEGHWAERYIVCAEQRGVRLFQQPIDLDRPAHRAEVLTIVHDVFGDTVVPLFSNFTDTVGHPYESDIAHAAFSGIVAGYKDERGAETGEFKPDAQINRAETAKVIYERIKLDAIREDIL
ncbi:MAG: S-layer homology domain-containing protein [Candidatus Peregrinibacteria bacterium]|nr:S-layer homology domain-containing protein [Candidatus Peregrinibacteria bacterium]